MFLSFMIGGGMKSGHLCFLLALAAGFFTSEKARASVVVIPDGNVTALKQAITAANSNNEDDIIILAGNGSYVLQSVDNIDSSVGANGLPVIGADNHHSLTISGNGSTLRRNTVGSPPPEFRLLQVAQNAVLQLNALTLTSGIAHSQGGGAIFSYGTLILNSCVVSGNTASATPTTNSSVYGGAIYNYSGLMSATDSTFSNNTATAASAPNGSGAGGGSAIGGAIFVATSLTRCTFTSNSCTAGNGGTANSGFISGNGGFTEGGAVYAVKTLTRCTFTNNGCQGGAGAAAATNGQAGIGGYAIGGAATSDTPFAVTDCSFTSNAVTGGASPGQTPGLGAGGALDITDNATVSGSTFTSNSATAPSAGLGGAAYVIGDNVTATFRNCTLAANSALSLGGGIEGDTPIGPGGHVVRLSLYNCTLSGNNASMGGGVYCNGGAGVYFANSIFRLGSMGTNLEGNFTLSQGHNITDDNGGAFGNNFNGPGDLRNTNPQLVTTSPVDNGGPTPTIAIGVFGSSPAINAADPTYATSRDQRGYFRTGAPDAGAYEYFAGVVGSVTGISRTGASHSDVTVSFEAIDRLTYKLQRKLNVTDVGWQDIVGVSELTATGNDVESITAPADISVGKAFYRVAYVTGP